MNRALHDHSDQTKTMSERIKKTYGKKNFIENKFKDTKTGLKRLREKVESPLERFICF